jgi:hypothetical protein
MAEHRSGAPPCASRVPRRVRDMLAAKARLAWLPAAASGRGGPALCATATAEQQTVARDQPTPQRSRKTFNARVSRSRCRLLVMCCGLCTGRTCALMLITGCKRWCGMSYCMSVNGRRQQKRCVHATCAIKQGCHRRYGSPHTPVTTAKALWGICRWSTCHHQAARFEDCLHLTCCKLDT